MRLFLLLIVLLSFFVEVNGQYTINDEELVYTTFTRSFDKSVIFKYLNSEDEIKVNAALLSIAHSEDSSFIPDIINLHTGSPKYISFALGQLPSSKLSSEYLINKLKSTGGEEQIYTAGNLGKIIQPSVFDSLINHYDQSVPLSLLTANYHFRGLKYNKEKALEILRQEVNKGGEKTFYALYSAYRTGLCSMMVPELSSLLSASLYSADNISKPGRDIIFYVAAALRKAGYDNLPDSLFQQILKIDYYPVQIEAVKLAVMKKPFSKDNLNALLNIVNAANINLAVQTLAAFREIKSGIDFSGELFSIIKDEGLDKRVRAEAAVSLYSLYPDAFDANKIFIEEAVPAEYMIQIYGMMDGLGYDIDKIIGRYSVSDNAQKIRILELLFNGKHNQLKHEDFILTVLNQEFAPGISIAASGLDSLFIEKHKELLKAEIIKTANKYLHQVPYIESLMSLGQLALRISEDFRNGLLLLFSESELYSLRRYAGRMLNSKIRIIKEDNNFKNVWNNSFKFKSALITTEKNVFEIELLPQYAPVSVGNFNYLTQLNFYKGIKFHRVVPGFVIQAGDPTNTGWGGSDFEIVSELSPLSFDTGYMGMASAGKDTEGSQWFIMQGYHPHLDGRYTVMGKIKTGINGVFNTGLNDKIISVELKN